MRAITSIQHSDHSNQQYCVSASGLPKEHQANLHHALATRFALKVGGRGAWVCGRVCAWCVRAGARVCGLLNFKSSTQFSTQFKYDMLSPSLHRQPTRQKARCPLRCTPIPTASQGGCTLSSPSHQSLGAGSRLSPPRRELKCMVERTPARSNEHGISS